MTATGDRKNSDRESGIRRGAVTESAPFGIYVHVPFCVRRCGYCAFVTYAPDELSAAQTHRAWADAAAAELDVAVRTLSASAGTLPMVRTVYFCGGTPTAVVPALLAALLHAISERFDTADDLEMSVEANPDGLTPDTLPALADMGATRVSFGMQSAVPRVLDLLDRTHDPESVPRAVAAARSAGIASVSLDLISGTPGERPTDWVRTLDAALALEPDHLSAYSLGIERGTKLAARVRNGALPAPSPDEAAERYEVLASRADAAGLKWYEISNWARTPADRCRHNLLYWRDDQWWGIGPGAHSHVDGRRWWNHPGLDAWSTDALAERVPLAGSETPTDDERRTEQIMLGIRLAEGMPSDWAAPGSLDALIADGLVTTTADRVVLTLHGRLLCDLVVRRLRWG